jgi:hypothetical protein
MNHHRLQIGQGPIAVLALELAEPLAIAGNLEGYRQVRLALMWQGMPVGWLDLAHDGTATIDHGASSWGFGFDCDRHLQSA